MSATYIKFMSLNGTVLTGTASTQWGEAIDPGYAQTLQAELENDQGSGVPTIDMPILDSGVAAAAQAAAAAMRGYLDIEVAGYDDQGRLINDIVIPASFVGSETVTADPPAPVAQTLSLQPFRYFSQTTSYDSSGAATTSSQGYDFKAGTSLGAAPGGTFSAPADPTSIASAATSDVGVAPFIQTDLELTDSNGNPLTFTGPQAPKIPGGSSIQGLNSTDLFVPSTFALNLTNSSSGATTGSVAFATGSFDQETPTLLGDLFQGSVLKSLQAVQVGRSNYAKSETTFGVMSFTNVGINMGGLDTRTYQLLATGTGQSATYVVDHWDPSGDETTHQLTLGAGVPGVDQVSTTAPANVGGYKCTFGIGSGSRAASYTLDDAEISFGATSNTAEVSPLTLTFANAVDAAAAAADFAAGSQRITIQDAGGDGTDTFTFQTAEQTVSNVSANAKTFSVSVESYQEKVSLSDAQGHQTSYETQTYHRVENANGTSQFVQGSVCYCAGTLIRTARSREVIDVAVEALQIGDLVVTASGARRPVRWLGHRTIDCRSHPRPREVMPVRIAAHAFGDDRPARDLLVSTGHAICLDFLGEVLVPAGTLVNGATIVRHPVESVTYWHVELDSHDVLLAENLPAESFLDCGNRAGLIEQEGEFDRTKGPHTPADFCRPFVDRGVVVDAFRTRLAARAEAQGWRSTSDMDLHLVVDGARVEADIFDGLARFLFPAVAREVVLASDSVVPSDLADSLDHRRLGLSVNRVEIDDGLSVRRAWAADDPCLATLFHPEEAAGEARHRFTDGRAVLPPALWDGCRGFVILRVGFDPVGTRHWLPPGRAEACKVVPLRAASSALLVGAHCGATDLSAGLAKSR